MPKHNFATLTCVSKTIHIISTTLYSQVNFTTFSGQIGLSFGGKCALSDTTVPAERQVRKYAAPW
ncbi:unnamed protein product [Staurois parvus]|uniref:Uncharacterized protein n=1 Tax=Staurois parvus TaxID=386267 RepID=A0ABN9GRB2_9NEOB|nr:unnamed protein product [Staurois parvus]